MGGASRRAAPPLPHIHVDLENFRLIYMLIHKMVIKFSYGHIVGIPPRPTRCDTMSMRRRLLTSCASCPSGCMTSWPSGMVARDDGSFGERQGNKNERCHFKFTCGCGDAGGCGSVDV